MTKLHNRLRDPSGSIAPNQHTARGGRQRGQDPIVIGHDLTLNTAATRERPQTVGGRLKRRLCPQSLRFRVPSILQLPRSPCQSHSRFIRNLKIATMPYPETTDAFAVTDIKNGNWSNFKRQEVLHCIHGSQRSLIPCSSRSRNSKITMSTSLSMHAVCAPPMFIPSLADGERKSRSRYA